MIPQAEALYHLQNIDLQIIQHRNRIKEISSVLEDNQVIAKVQGEIAKAEEHLKPLRAKVRAFEQDIQANNTKKKASEDRLYGGNVKSPKELQDIQHEIDSLSTRNQTLEEQLLEEMMRVEEAEALLQTHQAALQSLMQTQDEQHGELMQEQKDLAMTVQALKQDRERAMQQISAENLETYNTLRKKKANRPISLMQGNTCVICGVGQTTMTEQLVRQGQRLIYCDNCGRILVDMRS